MSLPPGISDITQNYQNLGGNISNSKSTFIQDSQNISKKIRLSLARERSWRLD